MVIRNPNSIYIPDYLNEEFLVNALEEGLREIKVTINEAIFEWGSNPGDNYCSRIYRVLVGFQRLSADQKQPVQEQLSLIIKTIPITKETRFLEDVGVFLKEKFTYFDVLPRLELLIDGYKFGAKCYYAIKSPMQTIVFDDLKVDGFTIASRQDQLDWEHSELILRQVGRLHATSMVLMNRHPDITKRLNKGMLSEETLMKSDTFENMFGGTLKQLAINSANWPGFEKISQKLHHFHNNFKSICLRAAERRKDDRIVVMNHGDLWTANFMYAYDDPQQPIKPTRAIFVDFQVNFYGSPGCDLNFLLNTSIRLDLLKYRRDELINVYFQTFTETLKYLHYENIPTLEDLKYELRARELYGLFALFGFLPIVTIPKEWSEDSSIDQFLDEEFARKKFEKIFSQERLQMQLKYALQRLEDLGVLDEF
ncbi:uncharacterized protein LOC129239687 [Anastrepha obliqua]|uniref:uncharacterized protein LOC129239687 n=1 Tax=Anastrepha obliqua TaxID=95512 RepID=UPI002408FA28|nr:uncharacterized protein LOC129239687 [Anastrepha obliqua]XP_054731373.1 uncharacterized protein LOC129239687 [Anastrepha obliqua]